MVIKQVKNNKEQYMQLLLEADPEVEVVKKYLDEGEMYIGLEDEKAVCEVVITKVNNEECELKNIATLQEYQGKRICKKINRICI